MLSKIEKDIIDMAETSAGLLMYAMNGDKLKVFLVHPGGPFFVNKDEGHWGIPKGLIDKDEDLLDAAIREFNEETGVTPHGEYFPLGTIQQRNGKIVYAWAFQSKHDGKIETKSNTFEMEWPPHSGKKQKFPEIDKGEFFTVEEAKKKMISAQFEFVDRLISYLYTK